MDDRLVELRPANPAENLAISNLFARLRPRWHRRAACREMDPRSFFHGSPKQRAQALSVCATCPVRAECAAAGADESYGIWGGSTEKERAQARRTVA